MDNSYFDSFELNLGPAGAYLQLKQRDLDKKMDVVGSTYFTSIEQLKSMAFILARSIKKMEKETGTSYPIPANVLNSWGIPLEDWEGFWK